MTSRAASQLGRALRHRARTVTPRRNGPHCRGIPASSPPRTVGLAVRPFSTTSVPGSGGGDGDGGGKQGSTADADKLMQEIEVFISNAGLLKTGPAQVAPEGASLEHPNEKEPITPLTAYIQSLIDTKGPITLAEFMRNALLHPQYGYYATANERSADDVASNAEGATPASSGIFGRKGDFVTAPEISQVFGELIGIWCVMVWMEAGRPPVRLVEMGPGNGTLMQDLLRVTRSSFPQFFNHIKHLHMVEPSRTLRKKQATTLGVKVKGEEGQSSTAEDGEDGTDFSADQGADVEEGVTSDKLHISWHDHLDTLPQDDSAFTLLVAQELLDALPVHQFVFTERGWMEKLVDLDLFDLSSPHNLRFVLSPQPTPASQLLMNYEPTMKKSGGDRAYRPPLRHKDRDNIETLENTTGYKIGDEVEVGAEALVTTQSIATKCAEGMGGAALIIDYGHEGAKRDSVRAIGGHAVQPLFASPGQLDITADVNFKAVKDAAVRVEGVEVHGPISQSQFLQSLGLLERLEMLIEANQADAEKCQTLISSCERLVHPEQMGDIYKVVAITSTGVNPVVFNPVATEEMDSSSAAARGRSSVSVTDNSAPVPPPTPPPQKNAYKPVDRKGN